MQLGLFLPTDAGVDLERVIELAQRAEQCGYGSVWVPEAYGTDAVSILGAVAARTERIELGSGILNVFSRTPALLAQTAVTLDQLSGGRFLLGLGTSGHQVVGGWHGIPFERPIQRLRETVTVVRQVVARESLRFSGQVFTLPQGLKLMTHPRRPTIPVFLATLTPAGLRLTGELADGWMPILFSPEHARIFESDLEAGSKASGRDRGTLAIAPTAPVAIGDDLASARQALRPFVALYVGGMGSRTRNYYNQTVRRYGFDDEAAEIQELYLGGKRLEAIRRVSDSLVDAIALVGPLSRVRERLQAYRDAGVTTLVARIHADDHAGALRSIELLAQANSG